MKLYLGCDHAAFDSKEILKNFLSLSHEVVDVGTLVNERCDYPDFASKVAMNVRSDEGSRGVILCGSGIGVSMVANRFKGIRAALCRTVEDAKLSREHNNSNVICVGARINSDEEIQAMIKAWFAEPFGEGRHAGRVAKFEQWGESL
jgi:ribose 5-phosphate isomerase B